MGLVCIAHPRLLEGDQLLHVLKLSRRQLSNTFLEDSAMVLCDQVLLVALVIFTSQCSVQAEYEARYVFDEDSGAPVLPHDVLRRSVNHGEHFHLWVQLTEFHFIEVQHNVKIVDLASILENALLEELVTLVGELDVEVHVMAIVTFQREQVIVKQSLLVFLVGAHLFFNEALTAFIERIADCCGDIFHIGPCNFIDMKVKHERVAVRRLIALVLLKEL